MARLSPGRPDRQGAPGVARPGGPERLAARSGDFELPLSVYGTLRPGVPALHRLAGCVARSEPAIAWDLGVYGPDRRHPHAARRAGAFTLGELIRFAPADPVARAARWAALDACEGVGAASASSPGFRRARWQAHPLTGGPSVRAWLCLASGPTARALAGHDPIASGDWLAARAEDDADEWRPRRRLGRGEGEEEDEEGPDPGERDGRADEVARADERLGGDGVGHLPAGGLLLHASSIAWTRQHRQGLVTPRRGFAREMVDDLIRRG